MKKTFNINISGVVFTIDEDAYDLLNDYLDTLQHAFQGSDDSHELLTDIENRIAELLTADMAEGRCVVTLADIEEIISRIGRPEEMLDDASSGSGTFSAQTGTEVKETTGGDGAENMNGNTPPPYTPPENRKTRKLFRDPQNAMLGGVCAGLAAYLNIDVTFIRLLTVVISLLSVSTAAIIYLILWIVVPEARTPYERMQMSGEEPTIANIGRTVTDSFKDGFSNGPGGDPRRQVPESGWKRFADGVANVFGVVAKILMICLIVVAIPVVGALAVALVGCIFALIVFSTSWGYALWVNNIGGEIVDEYVSPTLGLITAIGYILAIGIPLFALLWVVVMKKHPMTKGWRNSLIITWILGFVVAAVFTGIIILRDSHYERENIPENIEVNIETDSDIETDTITAEGVDPEEIAQNAETDVRTSADPATVSISGNAANKRFEIKAKPGKREKQQTND